MQENEQEQAARVPMSEEDLLQVQEFYQGVSIAGNRVMHIIKRLHQSALTISDVRWNIMKMYSIVNQPHWPSPPLAQCAGEKWVYRQALVHLKFPLVEDMPPPKEER